METWGKKEEKTHLQRPKHKSKSSIHTYITINVKQKHLVLLKLYELYLPFGSIHIQVNTCKKLPSSILSRQEIQTGSIRNP